MTDVVSAARVFGPTFPSTVSPISFWMAMAIADVPGPYMPSVPATNLQPVRGTNPTPSWDLASRARSGRVWTATAVHIRPIAEYGFGHTGLIGILKSA